MLQSERPQPHCCESAPAEQRGCAPPTGRNLTAANPPQESSRVARHQPAATSLLWIGPLREQ
ncbi:hypothetical protein ACFPM0_20595 [Pseudonocardia sulfidoxydans]|uniref:hypothetical protein n=1 Tax=Pseudonocardia sulfidoxydans TaxID=54011 RepID=UPI0036245502